VEPAWTPLPRQRDAYDSQADELFYGGAAGGGKSDLLLGLAFYEHIRSIVFRREYVQLSGLIDRSQEIYGRFGKFNNTKKRWQHFHNPFKVIEFGACQLEADKENYQGRAHDLKSFDEITQFTESMYLFLTNWCRTSIRGQRTRCVCTGNPPMTSDGEWVIKYWGPWLDEDNPEFPEEPGRLRWYATGGDGLSIEAPSSEPVIIHGEHIIPRSRTFIPARIEDNPYLIATGYKARLQALPEPMRSKMLNGDFTVGGEDHPNQIIPTAWVIEAQKRWRNLKGVPFNDATHGGIDVARGGKDRTVITLRHREMVSKQFCYDGHKTPTGDAIADILTQFGKWAYEVTWLIDVIGVGAAAYDAIKRRGYTIIPLHSSKKSKRKDKSKQLSFVNKRAQWYWTMRELLDPQHGENISIPNDAQLRRELCTPRWSNTVRGVLVESKEDIKRRIGKSIDKADSVVYSFADEVNEIVRYTNIPHMQR
jgi:hypothetical protein